MSRFTSVVTLTHNKLACTRRCLPTLLEASSRDWELIVVDNGSSDGTAQWLGELRAAWQPRGIRVTLVLNSVNIGCSTARNQGAAKASGDRLIFMDNDVALRSRSWLDTLGDCLDEDGVGMCGPKLVYPFPPHDIQCAGAAISPSGRPQFVGRGARRDDARFNARREAQCLISACFMVRRRAFEEAGGFDEAFNPVEFEDFDLCYRLRSRGYKAIYLPAAEMYHFESVTTAGTPSLPNTYLIVKHGMLFKKRWRHMFEREGGPPDAETKWRKISTPPLDSVGELPLTS